MKAFTFFLLVTLSCANKQMVVRRHNGRVNYIEKKLAAADLVDGATLTEDVISHVKKLSAPDDVIVQLVDAKIGGPGNSTANALPMNPSLQDFWKTKVTDVIQKYLEEHKSEELLVTVIPFYDNASMKRPNAFACYVVKMTNSDAAVLRAYIQNPPKSVSESVSPYIYSSEDKWESKSTNETYFTLISKSRRPPTRTIQASKQVKLSDLTTGRGLDKASWIYAIFLAGVHFHRKPYGPGLLLSMKIGGKGDDPYNVVPMVPNTVEEFEKRVEAPILNFFKDSAHKNDTVSLDVVVQYADNSSIPVGFAVLSDQFPEYCMYIPNR